MPAVRARARRGEARVGREERAGNKLAAQHGAAGPYSRSYGASQTQLRSRFYLLPSLQSLPSMAGLHKHQRRGRVLSALWALYLNAMHCSAPISHQCLLLQPACHQKDHPPKNIDHFPVFCPKGLGATFLGPGVRVMVNGSLMMC